MTTYARLPERMRIIELARRLDVPAAEVQKRLTRLNIDAPTVLTSVTRSDVRLVLEDYRAGDINGSPAPDPHVIDELLDSLGPSPLSRINDAAVSGRNDFVAHFRKEDDPDEDLLRHDLSVGSGRDDLAVQIDLDEASVEDGDLPSEPVVAEQLPERMRVFELAKRLDVPAADLLRRLNGVGIETTSVLKGVDRSDVRLVLDDYQARDVDGSTAPDPWRIDELLTSLGVRLGEDQPQNELEDEAPLDDSPDDSVGRLEVEEESAVDSDPANLVDTSPEDVVEVVGLADTGENASEDDEVPHLEVEGESVESDLADLDDGSPEDVAEVGLGDTGEDASEEDEVPHLEVEELPEADTAIDDGIDDGQDDESEELTPGADRLADYSPAHDLVDDELQLDHSSADVVDDSPDDVLGAALLQAGVIEDADTSRAQVEAEPLRSQTKPSRGLFRRWRGVNARTRIIAVGIGILIGTMLLSTVYAVLRPTYAAESEIVITISGQGSDAAQRELDSFAVVATSQTVLAPVAEQFGMSVTDVRDAFEPGIVGDSTVLRFTTNARSPEDALALNEAITASYLAVANEPLDQSELAFVSDRIDQVIGEIAAVDAELSGFEAEEAANASTRLQIETERNVAQAQLADLQGRLVDLRASGGAPPGSVTFIEGQINTTQTRLDEVVAAAQALESEDAGVRSAANRLRDERTVLRSELGDLQAMHVQIELNQIAGTRVAVLAPGHATDDAVGLTPVRAAVLGLLVGGALAFAWVVAATQLRKKK